MIRVHYPPTTAPTIPIRRGPLTMSAIVFAGVSRVQARLCCAGPSRRYTGDLKDGEERLGCCRERLRLIDR